MLKKRAVCLFSLIGCLPWLRYHPEFALDKWAKQFGGIYSMWLGTQLVVVISDPGVARDVMTKHSGVTGSRKSLWIKNQTILQGLAITGSPSNEIWYVLYIYNTGLVIE